MLRALLLPTAFQRNLLFSRTRQAASPGLGTPYVLAFATALPATLCWLPARTDR